MHEMVLIIGLLFLITLTLVGFLLSGMLRKKDEAAERKHWQLLLQLIIFWLATGFSLSLFNSTLAYNDFCSVTGQSCSHLGVFFSTVVPATLFWPTYTVSAALLAVNDDPLPLCGSVLAMIIGLFAVYDIRRRRGWS